MHKLPPCRRALTLSLAIGLAVITSSPATAAKATKKKDVKSAVKTVPISPELRKAINEAKVFVEKERGHTFKVEPPIEVLETKDFIKKFRATQDSDPDYKKSRVELASLMHALGFVDADADPNVLLDTLLDSAVAGYYDTKEKVLVIRGGGVTPAVKVILVHELTHALDGQYFELDRPELSKKEDDSAEAFSFVVEGVARMVENKYRATLSKSETAAVNKEEAASADLSKLMKVFANPQYLQAVPFLLTSLTGPYELGKEFAADVYADGKTAGLDKLYTASPISTEQANDFKAYKAGEKPRDVTAPKLPAGAKLVAKGTVGLASLNAMLADMGALSAPRIGSAAKGWGGDQYVLYTKDGIDCITIHFVMDTDKDQAELRSALTSHAKQRINASVSSLSGGVIGYQSCSK
jgi:hypothetical protein